MKLKKLSNQVMVITGASSGIGLATARMAARRGTKLVLAARSRQSLRKLVKEIKDQGGDAIEVVADVRNPKDVHSIAEAAHEEFGGFDTWVNNAGIGMYGDLEDTPIKDMRSLFETNFWGMVYGSLEAVKTLRQRGGTLINVGSTVSDRAIPPQGIYAASKHAVKGFTDSLRMELEEDDAPVYVTLIKPAAIDTPFTTNAKNFLGKEPHHAPPVYAPEAVARAILHAAESPQRDIMVGGSAKMNEEMGHFAPGLADRYMARKMKKQQMTNRPAGPLDDNALDHASEDLRERGNYEGNVYERSYYTDASMHPAITGAAIAGVGLAIGAAIWRARKAA